MFTPQTKHILEVKTMVKRVHFIFFTWEMRMLEVATLRTVQWAVKAELQVKFVLECCEFISFMSSEMSPNVLFYLVINVLNFDQL